MANPLVEYPLRCPYCGEGITMVLDISAAGQVYIEDCEVCCRPIEIAFAVDGYGELASVTARRLDE